MRAIRLVVLGLPLLCAARAEARLPGDVAPRRYAIALALDLPAGSFTGEETIEVDVKKATDKVVLHALEMEIASAKVTAGGRSEAATVSFDAKGETATLALLRPLAVGRATITLAWSAKLNDKLRGLYRGRDSEGRLYALTQFEGTDARRAFPCFDEPAYKARFQLTVDADAALTVISNTEAKHVTKQGGRQRVEFSESLPMSSYLVALAVGPYAARKGHAGRIPIAVWAPAGKERLGEFALAEAEQIVPAFERYFGVPYPFGKLDLIAAPEFQFGAMENIGAIIFREAALLADAKTSSPAVKQRVVEVIAHEVAHQWFGDLVTMAWWDDIWLNESFATWGEKRIISELHPDWHIPRDFAVERGSPLRVDELASTHPIRQPMMSGTDEPESSPVIIYSKGSAVLRMVERYLGEEAFRAGLRSYFHDHAFGNTRAEDFFASLGAASGKPVARVAGRWIQQAGHPVVSLATSCQGGHAKVALGQERFQAAGAQSDTLWPVPVCLRWGVPGGAAAREKCVLLEEKQASVELEGACPEWVMGNAGAAGFYRVAYDAAALAAVDQAAPRALSPEEQVALLDDRWVLAGAGRAQAESWLRLAAALGVQRDRAVLDEIGRTLEGIDRHLVDDRARPALQAFVGALYQPVLAALGDTPIPGEDDDRHRLRALAFERLGVLAQDPRVRKTALDKAVALGRDPAAVDATLVNAVVAVAAASGDATLYDDFAARMVAQKSAEERDRYLEALGHFSDPKLVARTLALSLGDRLRVEELDRPVRYELQTRAGRDEALRFLSAHVDEIARRASPYGMVRLVDGISALCGEPAAAAVDALFAPRPLPKLTLARQLAVESVRVCGAVRTRIAPAVSSWLIANQLHHDEDHVPPRKVGR